MHTRTPKKPTLPVVILREDILFCNRLGGKTRESLELRENHFCGFLKGIFEFNTPVKGTTVP